MKPSPAEWTCGEEPLTDVIQPYDYWTNIGALRKTLLFTVGAPASAAGYMGAGMEIFTHIAIHASRFDDCRRCPLHCERTKVVSGEGDPNARLLILAKRLDAPEDATGKPFVGAAGELLDRLLGRLPASLNDSLPSRTHGIFITNVCRCRPPMNRTPEPAEMKACAPYFWATLRALPAVRVIVALGNTPLRFLSEDPQLGSRSVGQWFDRDDRRAYHSRHANLPPRLSLRTGPASERARTGFNRYALRW